MMAFAARLASDTDGLESGLDRMDSVSVRAIKAATPISHSEDIIVL